MKPSSAGAVDGNGDLLTEILLRLPAKPLGRFKSVSRRWLSLITDRRFSLLYSRRNKPAASALLLCSSEIEQEVALVKFENFTLGPHHFQFLSQSGITILHSCNGFFCYSKLEKNNDSPILEYYVCNATTRKSVKIPLLGLVFFSRRHRGTYKVIHNLYKVNIGDIKPDTELTKHVLGMYVAFDPQNSHHCKVVCVWEWDASPFNYEIKITVYQSETGSWGEILGPFRVPYEVSFHLGVFWNNHLHWISNCHMVYFDIDGEKHNVITLPLTSNESKPIYLGESRGHLQVVINENSSDNLLCVFEMEKDYSLWVLTYRLHVEPILVLVPEIQLKYKPHAFSLIYLDRGENKDDAYILLGTNGKIMSYSLESKNLNTLGDVPRFHSHSRSGWAPFDRCKSFAFHETILEV